MSPEPFISRAKVLLAIRKAKRAIGTRMSSCLSNKNFKLQKGPTDKTKEPDPVGSDQQNYVGIQATEMLEIYRVQSNCKVSLSVFQFLL